MPILTNQKHERFAQAMAMPDTQQREAYLQAGFRGKSKDSQSAAAALLMRRPDIQERIAELRAYREKVLATDIQDVVKSVGPVNEDAFKRAGRARRVFEKVILPIEKAWIERGIAYADLPGGSGGHVVLKSVRADGTKISAMDTRTISVYQSALEHMARELGQWVDKAEIAQVKKLDDLTDEELLQLIADGERVKQEAAKKNQPPADSVN